MILGIDEVGRGPWAGPLVIGAVVLPDDTVIEGLDDSKKVTKKRRDSLVAEIEAKAAGFGLGWVHADELDEIGLSAALRLATIRAVEQITAPYHEIIIDGTINFLADTTKGRFVTTMPKADGLIPAVSAASILAKVARDAYMEEQALLYPSYGFERHVGYGTAAHRAALAEFGVTPLHRRSFAPIAALVGAVITEPVKNVPQSYTDGRTAESIAAEHLERDGYKIIERNWRIPGGEIDIIAKRGNDLYFVEVKHRRQSSQGGGLEAITERKRRILVRSAQRYVTQKKHHDVGMRFLAVATGGDNPKVLSVVEFS